MLYNLIYNLLSFVIITSIIVFIHEFGHYIVAKASGVKIEIFSIGFGKTIFSWVDKSNTIWKICILPVGGYVKMYGDQETTNIIEENKKDVSPKQPIYAFDSKPAFVKFLIVVAGPIANFILSIIIFAFFYNMNGKVIISPIIDKIQKNSSAEYADLAIGDKIVSINNKTIKSFSDIEESVIESSNQDLNILIERNNEYLTKVIRPNPTEITDMFGNKRKIPRIGISSNHSEIIKCNLIKSFLFATLDTYKISVKTLISIKEIALGKRDINEIEGPIAIAKYSGQSAKGGLNTILWFISILSINLGLMNLLPIPVLDGGHILFYIIEMITRKPVNKNIQQYSLKIGIYILFGLTIFSTVNDLLKIVNH